MPKRNIPRSATKTYNETNIVPLTAIQQQLAGLVGGRKTLYLALKYYYRDFQCFSEWERDELRQFSSTSETVCQLTVTELFRHRGLVPKSHRTEPKTAIPANLQQHLSQVTFTELRVTQKARIHGFIVDPIFFLVWLDRNHEVFPD